LIGFSSTGLILPHDLSGFQQRAQIVRVQWMTTQTFRHAAPSIQAIDTIVEGFNQAGLNH
jgi:hypothetical protein